ncbi:unnamed protein product, partial [marine sediment metagenome]
MYKNRIFIKDIYVNNEKLLDNNILVCGMIETIRKQTEIVFININDGTCLKGLQILLNKCDDPSDNFKTIFEKGTKGTIISVFGKLIESPAKGQDFELIASDKINYFGCICDPV